MKPLYLKTHLARCPFLGSSRRTCIKLLLTLRDTPYSSDNLANVGDNFRCVPRHVGDNGIENGEVCFPGEVLDNRRNCPSYRYVWIVAAHQILLDGSRALTPLADGPDHQRLTAAHVAGCKHLVDRCPEIDDVRQHIAARIERHAHLFDQPGSRGPRKPIASSTRSALSWNWLPGISCIAMRPSAPSNPFDAHALQRFDLAATARPRAWSAPPSRDPRLPHARARCAASAASPARSAPCSRAPAASAGSPVA